MSVQYYPKSSVEERGGILQSLLLITTTIHLNCSQFKFKPKT